jgi:hypothetical protein
MCGIFGFYIRCQKKKKKTKEKGMGEEGGGKALPFSPV